MKIFYATALLMLVSLAAVAQYYPNFDVPVEDINGVLMKFPWVGGLNNPQFSDGDLNNDGIKDLFVFDRNGNRILTFINQGTANSVDYKYAPEIEKQFPHLHDWALLRDYNCDGIPDIWCYSTGSIGEPGVGIQVYRGYYTPYNAIAFVSVDSSLRMPFNGSEINLYVSSVDIPAIADVNGDGDLDVLTFQVTGGFVMYFENQSEELGFGCDSLTFIKKDDCWGDFYEPSLKRTDDLNQSCPFFDGANGDHQPQQNERHTGSVETAWDNDGDGDLEFLKGDISFTNLNYMINGGTPTDAHMTGEDTSYPAYDKPVDMVIFPAPFLVDVNNDGLKDLLVSPNAPGGSENLDCSWYYKNTGNAVTATFTFQTDTFLNGDMIEVGEGCYPVFFDADGDGLLDLIVGNRGYFDPSQYIGKLAYYKNIGDAQHPSFKLITKDYADVSSLHVLGVYPAFADLDGDGDADMLLGQEDGSILFFKNIAAPGAPANFIFFSPGYQGIDVGNSSAPQLIDVNRDGLVDLLVGNSLGLVEYFQNSGSASNPVFTLTNDSLGKVNVHTPGYFNNYATPFMYDQNDGNGYQLLVGSIRGTLFHYNHIDNNLNGTFTKTDTVFSNINEGLQVAVSGADVNDDGKVDLLVGNYRGGVTFYDSQLTGIDPVQQALYDAVQVYPNPATDVITVLIDQSTAARVESVSLFNLMGKRISTTVTSGATKVNLSVRAFPAGVYLIEVNTINSRVVKKMVVSHF